MFKQIYFLLYHQRYDAETGLDVFVFKASYDYFYKGIAKHVLPFFGVAIYFLISFSKPDRELLGSDHTFNIVGNFSVTTDAFFIFMPVALLGYWAYLSYLLLGCRLMSDLLRRSADQQFAADQVHNFFLSGYFAGLFFLFLPVLSMGLLLYASFPLVWVFRTVIYGAVLMWPLAWLFFSMYYFLSDRVFFKGLVAVFFVWSLLWLHYDRFMPAVRSTYLFGQSFSKQDFRFMNLSRANLTHATFSYSDFSRAILNGAVINHAKFENSNLVDMQAVEASLLHTDLSGSNLSFSDLSGADLRFSNLKGVNLKNVNLQDTDVSNTNISMAQYQSSCNGFFATLGHDQFIKFGLPKDYRSKIESRLISDFLFLNPKFCGLRLKSFVFVGNGMSNADFSDSKMVFTQFLDNFMNKANFSGANLRGLSFSQNYLVRANFNNALLTQVEIEYSDLSNASFRGVKLYNSSFRGSDLLNVDFEGAHFVSVDLRGAQNLSCDQLKKAAFFDRVKLDVGCSNL